MIGLDDAPAAGLTVQEVRRREFTRRRHGAVPHDVLWNDSTERSVWKPRPTRVEVSVKRYGERVFGQWVRWESNPLPRCYEPTKKSRRLCRTNLQFKHFTTFSRHCKAMHRMRESP